MRCDPTLGEARPGTDAGFALRRLSDCCGRLKRGAKPRLVLRRARCAGRPVGAVDKGGETFRLDAEGRCGRGVADESIRVFSCKPIEVGDVVPRRRSKGGIQTGGKFGQRNRDEPHRPPRPSRQQGCHLFPRRGGRPADIEHPPGYAIRRGRCDRILALAKAAGPGQEEGSWVPVRSGLCATSLE